MIRHVVLLSWTTEATGEQNQRVASELRQLVPQLTGLRAYHVGPDAGLTEGNFDFAVIADFDDAESYRAYRDHPAHRAIIEQFITPVLQDRASVQYSI